MMLHLLLFPSNLVVLSSWYSCFSFHDVPLFLSMMFLFLVFFLWCPCSCFPTYQSHSSCDPPPISRSFNYELGGCKCVKICRFAQCLAIVTCLVTHCAFVVNLKFTPWYPNRCAHHPIWNFCGNYLLHFLLLL